MYGTSLAVLCFTNFVSQRELLKKDKKNTAISTGMIQGGMSSVLMTTFCLGFPELSSLPLISLIGWGLLFLPITAGLCSGGYAKIKNSQFVSSNKFLKSLTTIIDSILYKIPTSISSSIVQSLSGLHSWIGSALYAIQLGIFAIITPVQPVIGISGLVYSGMCYALDNNILPTFLSRAMEKFNYWVNLCSGIFLHNTILKVISIFNLAKEFLSNIFLPKILKSYIRKDAEFLQVADSLETHKATPKIPRDISRQKFISLLKIFAELPNIYSVDNGCNNTGRCFASLSEEIDDVISGDFEKEFCDINKRIMNPHAASFYELKSNAPMRPKTGLFEWVKYCINSIIYYPQYAVAWMKMMHFTSNSMFITMNSLLDKLEAKESGLAVTVHHLADFDYDIDKLKNLANKSYEQELAIYLQQQRQKLFEDIYCYFQNLPPEKLLFPFMNFDDEYTYDLMVGLFKFINIKSDFEANGDISNNQLDILTQMQCSIYVHFAMRLMMTLDQAYSPKGILRHMGHNDIGAEVFTVRNCCAKWAQDFTPLVCNYIASATKADRSKLYALMLYDLGIFKAVDPILEERIDAVLNSMEFDLTEDILRPTPGAIPIFIPSYRSIKKVSFIGVIEDEGLNIDIKVKNIIR